MTYDDDHGGLTCAELVMLVTEYLEGALSAEDRARFEKHIEVCADCAEHLEQMRLTIAAAGRLREEQLPAGAQRALLKAFRDWKRAEA